MYVQKNRLYVNPIDTPNREFDFVLQYKNDITDDKLKNIEIRLYKK